MTEWFLIWCLLEFLHNVDFNFYVLYNEVHLVGSYKWLIFVIQEWLLTPWITQNVPKDMENTQNQNSVMHQILSHACGEFWLRRSFKIFSWTLTVYCIHVAVGIAVFNRTEIWVLPMQFIYVLRMFLALKRDSFLTDVFLSRRSKI